MLLHLSIEGSIVIIVAYSICEGGVWFFVWMYWYRCGNVRVDCWCK
jgi:hypothetical protein